MSLTSTQWAWKQTVRNPTEKIILLALADFADRDGNAWPSIEALCAKTQASRSSVYSALKNLGEQGLIREDWRTAERQKPVKAWTLNPVQDTDDHVQTADETVQGADKTVQTADESVRIEEKIHILGTVTEQTMNKQGTNTQPEQDADSKLSRREAGEAFKQVWNANRGTLPQCRSVTAKIAAHVGPRLASKALRDSGLLIPDDYARLVQALASDDFHSGGGSRGWKADLEWLLRNDDNVLKALEMAEGEVEDYDDDPTVCPQPPPLTPEEAAYIEAQLAELRG